MAGDVAIMHGTACESQARRIAESAGLPIIKADVTRFKNGEVSVKNVGESVRGKRIFLVQTGGRDVNNELIETLVLLDALKRAGVGKAVAVLPHFPYARQDHKDGEREPISAALVASLLKNAGADELVSVDLHSSALPGFFEGNFENVRALPLFRDFLKQSLGSSFKDVVIVSPDFGGLKRVEALANQESLAYGAFNKHRPRPSEAHVTMYLGPDVRGKTVVLLDDMIDSGSSMLPPSSALKEKGAKKVIACATHAIFSGNAVEKLEAARDLDEVIVTDSVPVQEGGKIKVIELAHLLGRVVNAMSEGKSVSALTRL
ncbi:hypothetical protein AUJ65_03565 [Candidatus Micrarchaeota archaeon CG1_02_51_15]|nr:MAG: hypothetical protein AUJ65_03565 [Candidatus Micrarchaeota archaeon CG1_02_51_15]